MYRIYLLFALVALISADTSSLLEKLRLRRNNANRNYVRRMVSFCDTHFELTVVNSAIQYNSRQHVRIPHRTDKSNLYYVGSCTSNYPITHSRGVCAITMQRHRGIIRVTREQAKRFHYKSCKTVRRHPMLQDCSEWIELPGLCQHKMNG